MKKIFSTSINDKYAHITLLVVRVLVGTFMLTHGVPKFMRLFSGEEIQFADPFGLGPGISLFLSMLAEFFCSIFIILGLGTRLAAIPLIINMLVVVFYAHSADPFGKKELPLLYLLFFITFLVLGSGKYSVDSLLSNKRRLY